MPGSHSRENKYSTTTGVIFLFNLIVGTGALMLPGAFQKAGWVMGAVLLLVLAMFSFITVTFVVESLAVANAISRKRFRGSDTSNQEEEEEEGIEETPLVLPHDGSESNVFEIKEKYEIGQMGVLVSPKWCQVIIYISLCLYLFGDLAIYAVVIGNTCAHVLCTHKPQTVPAKILENDFCWEGSSLTKLNIYRLSVAIFILLMGPFVFFQVQKTKFLQIIMGIMRMLAFVIMFVWSIEKLVVNGKEGNPPVAKLKSLPTLFGSLVYSFMCQHSIPGLLQPITNKNHLKAIIGADYILITVFYLAVSLTSIFAFQKVCDLYMLNFWEVVTTSGAPVYLVIFAYYLALFPVFTLSTSFPIVGITLKNNLRAMILKDIPPIWYYDKLLFPLVTIIPPTVLALIITDIHLLIGITGSYAGVCVQYLIPCMLVFFSRAQAEEFNTVNIYASPFKHKYWIYAVYVWMFVSIIFISFNYSISWD